MEIARMNKSKKLLAYEVLGMVCIVFTFYAPHLPIFQDSINGGYGID